MEYENIVTVIEKDGNIIENYGSEKHNDLALPIYKELYESIPEKDRQLDDKSLVSSSFNVIGNGVRYKKDLVILRTRGEVGKNVLFVIVPSEITKEQLVMFEKKYSNIENLEFSDYTNINDNAFSQLMGVVDFQDMYNYLDGKRSKRDEVIDFLKVKHPNLSEDAINTMINDKSSYNKALNELEEQERIIDYLRHIGKRTK